MQRLEGLSKLTGAERYLDDTPIDGCLWGMTVRSPVSRGVIKAVRFDPSINWSEFVVVDHRDIPGPNETYLIENDQPVLAGVGGVRHMHEAVVLIAHPDRDKLRRAVASVKVEIDPLPPVLDYRLPPRPDQIQRGSDNLLKALKIQKGDVAAALRSAHRVVEGVYETGAQEHVYIENNAMAAWIEPGTGGDVVVVRGSLQCPYYVLNALKHALGRDETRVRVIQAPTGGGFGGKEDYPSTIALHAALLTLKARQPVKIVYDRGEDMACTTKRHPSRVRHRTGVDRDGRFVAQEIDVLLDGGAYVTLSPVVLSRGIIHAAGPYHCPNVLINGRAVLSNSVPYGAFRGFGAPQTLFACERHMDRIAAAIGMDPVELRRINLLKEGDTTSTGQVTSGGTDRHAILDQALKAGHYQQRKQETRAFNGTHPYLRRGVGVSTILHGAGFTGNGEVYLNSKLDVAGLPDGRVEVLAASTEMGQGTNTVFTKIASDALKYDPADVVIAVPDTARVPNSGPTVASRTVMVVGRLIERACEALAAQAGAPGATGAQLKAAITAWHRTNPGKPLTARATYEPPPGVKFDDKTYTGDAYATFAWGACVATIEVDLRTGLVRVLEMTAVQDIGRVLNPVLAKGQVQGGVVQAIGWALMEECRFHDGGMINNQLTNYIIPTSDDVPPINVVFYENPYRHGGGGAKGVGELPMDGPAPAILNAVADATGADPLEIPLTPERLMPMILDEAAV
jgi:CO/xanthine dehydrogenase Mo-binding subunit